MHNFNDGGMKQEVDITGGESYRLTGYAWVPSGSVETAWGSLHRGEISQGQRYDRAFEER
jgi:hypothetical protein